MNSSKINLLIAVTGSVATIKLPKLIEHFKKEFKLKFNDDRQLEIRIVRTENAAYFFNLNDISDDVQVYCDSDEWKNWNKIGDPILHIDLRNWATLLLIAPLDANTLAKLANGLCDNLLTCIVRAWDLNKPVFYAPAMNTYMWRHSITSEHLAKLQKLGYQEIQVIEKKLACGDTGLGAMEEVERIVDIVLEKV